MTVKPRFPPFVRSVVRDFTQLTIGQEVVEETETVIAIKDLLNPAEIPFDNTIRWMFLIVKAMHEDAITAFETHNKALLADVKARDTDADQLNWLVARQTTMILRNPALSKKMGIPPSKAMHYYLISRIIERIEDHAERIAGHSQDVIGTELDKKIMAAIKKASALSLEIFDRSIVSFFNTDMKEANRNIESINTLEKICGEISNMVLKQETVTAVSIGYIAESIRRSGEYAGDISETVINMLVENQTGARTTRSLK